MSTLVLEARDTCLGYDTDCLVIRQPEQPPRSVPLSRLSKLVCLHNTAVTTQLLGQLYQRGIDFVVLNGRYPEHSLALYADTHHHAKRRCGQYAWQWQSDWRLRLAKVLCRRKFRQSLWQLRAQPGNAAQAQLEMALESLEHCFNESQLRGLEGSVQRTLFGYWRTRLDPDWGFVQRARRPPPDPVNALLSLTYTLVHHEAARQAKRYGLDPELGVYHRLAWGRQSLACDLMEPLRPRIEAWVVELLNQGLLHRRHFSAAGAKGCHLGKAGRLLFYPQFETALPHFRRSLASHCRWLVWQLDRQSHPLPIEDEHE